MTFKRTTIFPWLIALLSLVPVSLYAYLGQFSRLIADDYREILYNRDMAFWDGLRAWYLGLSGAYANFLAKSVMLPLGPSIPRIAPTIIIVLWMVGLSWLVFQGLACLEIRDSRRALAVAISAAIVAASIHAFYTPLSLYWHAASTDYTLPLVLFTIYMALAFWMAQRLSPSLWALIAGGLLCFISAGFSEMFLVFQVAFLTLCLLLIFAFLRSSVRYRCVLVFGVGWLATLVGLIIQLSSPAVPWRLSWLDEPSARLISVLVPGTLNRTMDYIENPQVFLGFVMLMGVGLLVMLLKYKPQEALEASQPVKLALPPLWLGLFVQLIWVPLLWLHTSDNPQFLGRFSISYTIVIILNAALILGFLVLLWQRDRIQAQLQKRERGALIVYGTMAFVFVCAATFALTQENVFYRTASSYLFMSFLVFGGIIISQLSSLLPTSSARKFGWFALLSYVIAVICTAAMTFMALYARGFVPSRILSSVAHLLVLSGLVWGAWMGYMLKHCPPSFRLGQVWVKLLKLASLALILTIGIGIVLGQAALVPDFQLFAREWDARHQSIIARRDSGQTTIEIAPLTFELAEYFLSLGTVTQHRSTAHHGASRYYGVELIGATDG